MNQMNDQCAGSGVEALLAGYVAGTLSEPLNALVAAHLEMSPANRGYTRALEHAAGVALEGACAVAAPIKDRDAKLAAIFALDKAPAVSRPRAPARSGVLPAALERYMGCTFEAVPWKTLLPGVKTWHIAGTERGEASLHWIRAGQKMPADTHGGMAVTLLLQGGFLDSTGHYVRGDVVIADEDVVLRPVADDDGEDCLCFTVTDVPLRLAGPFGRWVQPFLKR
jgi:putative transcriptional regulator